MESIKVYENFMTISISKNGIKKKKKTGLVRWL